MRFRAIVCGDLTNSVGLGRNCVSPRGMRKGERGMEKGDDRKTDDQKSWPNEQSSFWENLVLHGGRGKEKCTNVAPDGNTCLTRILA